MKYHQVQQEKARLFFQKNKTIESPCIGVVTFNSQGFRHLICKNKKHKRDLKNQLKRFELLEYFPIILSGMTHYQEYCEEMKGKTHIYWSFVAIIKNKLRLKIILRKIGHGHIHFWSVIPVWKTIGYRQIRVHKGNLEED